MAKKNKKFNKIADGEWSYIYDLIDKYVDRLCINDVIRIAFKNDSQTEQRIRDEMREMLREYIMHFYDDLQLKRDTVVSLLSDNRD